jgi:hypothetical protein
VKGRTLMNFVAWNWFVHQSNSIPLISLSQFPNSSTSIPPQYCGASGEESTCRGKGSSAWEVAKGKLQLETEGKREITPCLGSILDFVLICKSHSKNKTRALYPQPQYQSNEKCYFIYTLLFSVYRTHQFTKRYHVTINLQKDNFKVS